MRFGLRDGSNVIPDPVAGLRFRPDPDVWRRRGHIDSRRLYCVHRARPPAGGVLAQTRR